MLGALREVPRPEDDSLLVVQVGDLDTAIAHSGLARDGALDETAWEWMGPLFSFLGHRGPEAPIYVPLPGVFPPRSFQSLPALREELGWSVVDVDAFVEMNAVPGRFSVLAGGFDDQTLAHLPEVADGVVTAGGGEDLEDQTGSATPARRLGRPLRMAQSDGRIAASLTLPAVQEWVGGPEDTLADDEDLARGGRRARRRRRHDGIPGSGHLPQLDRRVSRGARFCGKRRGAVGRAGGRRVRRRRHRVGGARW